MDLPTRLSPGDATPRGEEKGHSSNDGHFCHGRGQGDSRSGPVNLSCGTQRAQGHGGRPLGPLAAAIGPDAVAHGYPVLVDERGLVRVPDVSCCEHRHGMSQMIQGSHSFEHSQSHIRGDDREQGGSSGVASSFRGPWTDGGEAHGQALGAQCGQGQAALRMRTPSRHLRQAAHRAVDGGSAPGNTDSCTAEAAGPGTEEASAAAGPGLGAATETVAGAGAMAAPASAPPTSSSVSSTAIPAGAASGVAAVPWCSHVSPFGLLARHLHPGPLLLCFFLGLGLGLVLTEPQATPALDLASLEGAVAIPGMPPVDSASVASAGTTRRGPWDHAALVAQGRTLEKAGDGALGVGNDNGAAEGLLEGPSAEQRVLEDEAAGGVGQCGAYHRMDVASLRPRAGGLRPLLLIVTPTYVRPFQAMYLRRLANLLRLVPPPLLWIVVEIGQQTAETATLLRSTGLQTRHIVTPRELENIKDRGVNQRNAALEYIEEHRLDGIVYFADDDNVYSPALFHEIRKVRRFGTWPVALMQQGKSRTIVEGPVCQGQSVVGWHTNEKSKRVRRFHVDMSGFAFNSSVLWQPQLFGRPTGVPIRQLDTVKEGFQETTFIEQLVPDESHMEGLANGCTEVLVWHLHSEALRTSPFPRWSSPSKAQAIIPARTQVAWGRVVEESRTAPDMPASDAPGVGG